jgi:SAM-dependent methyltransferase
VRKDAARLTDSYGRALLSHGATPQGVLWPNGRDLAVRFETLLGMLGVPRSGTTDRIRLLDLGCGPGLLLDFLAANDLLSQVDYTGVDALAEAIEMARSRWPDQRFERRDVRDAPFPAGTFDVCMICGIFTGRFALSHDEMETMARETLTAVWPSVSTGLAFNAMSAHVDWQRDDLFHWPLDTIMAFCKQSLSRHVAFRLDYGLWETAVHVRKEPAAAARSMPAIWSSTPGETRGHD